MTQSIGKRKIPMRLAASIPANTGVLTLWRAISEAPAAHTRGASPAMNAIEVVITARKRISALRAAAS